MNAVDQNKAAGGISGILGLLAVMMLFLTSSIWTPLTGFIIFICGAFMMHCFNKAILLENKMICL